MPDTVTDKVTDKQVDKARSDVEKLRAQVEEAKLELAASEAARNNGVQMVALDAEKEALKAELAALQDRLKESKAPLSQDQGVQQIMGEETGVATPDTASESTTETKEK